jgi:membrane-anchored glycerophosphoryl diester phosphodiesterase (GDPDase)
VIAYGFTNAVLLRINAVCHGKQLSFGEALSAGFRLVARTFGFFLLLGFGFGLAVAFILLPALAMRGTSSASSQVIMGVLLIIAAFIFIYVGIRLAVAYPAMIVDDLSVTSAISTSWKMTKGFWWRVATLITVLGVVVLALGALLGVVAGGTAGLVGANKDVVVPVTQIASVIMYAFLGSLSPAVILAIYNDLKLRRQGGDLADRVSALAAQ